MTRLVRAAPLLAFAYRSYYRTLRGTALLPDSMTCARAALQSVGCKVVRGSSRRGGKDALAALILDQQESHGATAIVVDGPLGPVGIAKPGAAFLSMRTGRRLRALGAAARREVTFRRTWSQVFVPLPFTRVAVAGELVELLPSPSMDAAGGAADAITRALGRARQRALDYVARPGESNPKAR